MATTASPQTRPLVIFTDSLTTLKNLLQRQRKDAAPSNTPPSIERQLTSLIQALNCRTTEQTPTTLVKIKAHRGDPLNERADYIAYLATQMKSTPETDPPTTLCLFKLNTGPFTPWSRKLGQTLTQQFAMGQTSRRHTKPHLSSRTSQEPHPSLTMTERWLLWQGTNRQHIGSYLASGLRNASSITKRILQTLSNTFPTALRILLSAQPNNKKIVLTRGDLRRPRPAACRSLRS